MTSPDNVGPAPQHLLALFSARDVDVFIDAAFHLLSAAVACDFVSAFYRSADDGLLRQRDSRGREYSAAFMRRYMELTPALSIARANPGIKVLPTRAGLPLSTAELQKTAFYNEIMRPQGWRHAVALCFWGNPAAESPVFVTSAYRREGLKDFSTKEIVRLEGIHRFLDCAVNRLLEGEMAESLREGMALAAGDDTRGLAIVDRNFVLAHTNSIARELCAAWSDEGDLAPTQDASGAPPLAPVLVATCRQLYDEWQTLLRTNLAAVDVRRHRRITHPRIPGLAASITMVCPNTTGLSEPTFVLEFERRVQGVALHAVDQSVPLVQRLTAAERTVAMVLADGLSNQEIADQLGKSIHAVKFLLHKIYRKTGIPNRAALVAILRSTPKSRKGSS